MTASVANSSLVNAYALHDTADRAGVARWSVSALAIVAAHVALIAAGMAWVASAPPPGTMVPAIMVDLAPVTSAPEPQQQDIAPGPEMQQAEEQAAPPPEPLQRQAIQEQIPATPPQLKPEVVAPPEHKPEPTPPKPEPPKLEPAKVTPEPKPEPAKPKPVHREVKKPSEHPPAPRTSAAPKADRRAELAAAARAGAAATAAALPAYRDLLAAHLQRYKQYPSSAKAAGEQGTAMLTFTVSRSGRVLSSRLARSSGHAALDAETMAMIQRAQPLPAFPHDLPQASMNFTVPVRFAIR
jgi:protein TonB